MSAAYSANRRVVLVAEEYATRTLFSVSVGFGGGVGADCVA